MISRNELIEEINKRKGHIKSSQGQGAITVEFAKLGDAHEFRSWLTTMKIEFTSVNTDWVCITWGRQGNKGIIYSQSKPHVEIKGSDYGKPSTRKGVKL